MEMLVSSALDPGSALPSFFEMFMTHQIQLSLKPAVRHVIGALVLRIPALWPLARRFEEAYLLLSLAVEGQFLAQHDCLMVESFYALGRSRLARHGPSGGSSSANSRGGHRLGAADAHAAINLADFVRLTARDRRKALLIAVLLPYAKARLDALHAQCVARSREATAAGSAGSIAGAAGAAAVAAFEGGAAGGNSNGGGSTSTAAGAAQLAAVAVRRRLAAASAATAAQLFVSAYPCVHACYEGAFLAYHWLYLFGRSAYFSPALHAVGQVVRRSTAAAADDDGAFSGEASSGAIGGSGSSVGGGGGGSEGEGAGLPTLGDKALRYGRAALVAAVVLFKVMEWWTAVEAREGFWKAGAHVDVPPPLPMPPAADADDNGGGGGSSGSEWRRWCRCRRIRGPARCAVPR
ncbi:unnamed protein product [Phaeothamnion confervicola]